MIFADAVKVKMQLDAVRGPQGETGPAGPMGPTGERGAQGREGRQGERGESAYEAAVRMGLTKLSEEAWLKEYDAKRSEAVEAVLEAGAGQVQEVLIEGARVLAGIPADYRTMSAQVDANTKKIPAKADAVIDKSGKAPYHRLHAQQNTGLSVKLHGITWRAGTDNPTPEKPTPLYGVETAAIMCSGKNLFSAEWYRQSQSYGFCVQNNADGTIHLSGTRTSAGAAIFVYRFPFPLPPGRYALSANNTKPFMGTGSEGNILLWFKYQHQSKYTLHTYLNNANASSVIDAQYPIEEFRIRIGENVQAIEEMILRPQVECGGTATPYERHISSIMEIPVAGGPLYGNGVINDTVETDVLIGGRHRSEITRHWGVIDSYAGEAITTEYISSTGGLDPGAQVIYQLPQPLVTVEDAFPMEATGWKPETITGSGDTEVTYTHDTKHYIDEKFAELAAAMIGG